MLIERVARELMSGGRLTYDEVDAIVVEEDDGPEEGDPED